MRINRAVTKEGIVGALVVGGAVLAFKTLSVSLADLADAVVTVAIYGACIAVLFAGGLVALAVTDAVGERKRKRKPPPV